MGVGLGGPAIINNSYTHVQRMACQRFPNFASILAARMLVQSVLEDGIGFLHGLNLKDKS
jgi:hypothetical protein